MRIPTDRNQQRFILTVLLWLMVLVVILTLAHHGRPVQNRDIVLSITSVLVAGLVNMIGSYKDKDED